MDEELTQLLTTVIEQGLLYSGYREEAEVGVILVNDEEIREMNREYRHIDQPTDVLSFALLEGEPQPTTPGAPILLGDIVISLPTATRQAAEYGHSLNREVTYLAVHGLLHLLGYDHIEEEDKGIMRQKEEEILRMVSG